MGRKNISAIIQRNTLINSRRRCAVCYGLFRDKNIKTGQIAHIDGNNANNSPENLLFLCLIHHDIYDTKTSQSKNITKEELEYYRDELYEKINNVMDEKSNNNLVENEYIWDKRIYIIIHNMLVKTKAVDALNDMVITGTFAIDFFIDLEQFITTCETDAEFCFKNDEMDKYRQDMYIFLKNFFQIAVYSQYDYNTDKSYIPKKLNIYSEICNSLDEYRARFIYSYRMLVQKGIKLGYI